MLYCIIGASGTGKSTLVDKAVERCGMSRVITCTTRERRVGEPKSAYHFLSDKEFDQLVKKGELIESDEYHGHPYGTAYFAVHEALQKGDTFIITTASGYENLRERYQCRGFVLELDPNILRARMEKRGDSKEAIESRLNGLNEELERNAGLDCTHIRLSGDLNRDTAVFLYATVRAQPKESIEKEESR